MDFAELARRAQDPNRPECRWVVALRTPRPPLEEMAAELAERLLAVDYVVAVAAPERIEHQDFGIGPEPVLRGLATLVPLAELPEDDPSFERIKRALTPSWASHGSLEGVLPPHPTAAASRGVEDHYRRQAASMVRQIIEDSRYDDLTAEQREVAIALNTVWAATALRLRDGRPDALVSDPVLMAHWTVIHDEIARELAERGNLPSWMWDDRFWDAAGLG